MKVFVRVRPPLEKEQPGHFLQLSSADGTVRAAAVPISGGPTEGAIDAREFTYDAVFPPNASQSDVFCEAGLPILRECLRGYNGTILAYGQTGSGKTYTLLDDSGLLPRLTSALFEAIAADTGSLYEVDISVVQIYNDQADDLLDDSRQNLPVQSTGTTALTWQRCLTPLDLTDLVHRARQNLVYAETQMNKASSRSHAIFQLRIRRRVSSEDGVTGTCSLLRVVDLAGSERTKKSKVEGLRLKETNAINRSLLALGNVVNALAFRKQHVPIRDSKLTLMLSDSLGGNCKTAMLVCVGPCASHAAETLSSLEFASRAMHIEVHACVNVLPCAAAEPWVEGYVQGLSEQAEGFRLAAARGAERAAQAEEALVDAERRRNDAELRLAALEEAAALWEARALDAEAAVAAERRRAGDEAAACEAQRQRERHLAAEALERERRHSGRLSDAVACLEEQLADRSNVMAELMAQAEELSDRARALEVKAQEQSAMSEELQLQLSRKEQALATDGMSFASIVRSASAKEVAAQKLLADAERRSEELARREGDVQRTAECFESERLHLVEECRQEVEREKSELRARLQLREDRVNSHLADCNRRAEVELERRLSLLASREASAAEALRQKQQIQDQAKTIEDLQHQLERQKERLWRATSEPQIRYSTRKSAAGETRRPQQVPFVSRHEPGPHSKASRSRNMATLTLLLPARTPSTGTSTPAASCCSGASSKPSTSSKS